MSKDFESSIAWSDLVDVPAEEPQEAPQEPWQLYMTDRGCKAAVERYSAEHDVSLADAAREVAKTITPAPHNFVAATARYLLAPETEQADNDAVDTHLSYGQGVDAFEASAHRQASYDGPRTEEGARYSEGLTNRAGENPPSVDEMSQTSVFLIYGARGEDIENVPPSIDEPGGDGLLRTLRQRFPVEGDGPSGWFHDQNGAVWDRAKAYFNDTLEREDLIPVEPPTLSFEQLPSGRYDLDIEYRCVPARGRTYQVMMLLPIDEAGQLLQFEDSDLDDLRAEHPCQHLEWNNYGSHASVVAWAKHFHHTVQSEGGPGFDELLRLFGVDSEESSETGSETAPS